MTATIEAQRQIAARNLSQNGFFNTLPFVKDPFVKGFGDTIISGKYWIQHRQGSLGGISLSGFVKIPHADETTGLGSGKVDGGIELVFTSSLPLQFLLNSSMGLVSTSDAELPVPIRLKDELRSGIGVIWPAGGIGIYGGGIVQGIFEYTTVTFIGAGSPNDVIQAPSDLTMGFRYLRLNRGITFSGGYRRNSNFDREFPGNTESDGFVFGITYNETRRAGTDKQLPSYCPRSRASRNNGRWLRPGHRSRLRRGQRSALIRLDQQRRPSRWNRRNDHV